MILKQAAEQGKVKFPVKTDLRIMMDQTMSAEDAKSSILKICSNLSIGCSWSGMKQSSGGKFSSYCIVVVLKHQKDMDSLYRDLGALPGIKMVL